MDVYTACFGGLSNSAVSRRGQPEGGGGGGQPTQSLPVICCDTQGLVLVFASRLLLFLRVQLHALAIANSLDPAESVLQLRSLGQDSGAVGQLGGYNSVCVQLHQYTPKPSARRPTGNLKRKDPDPAASTTPSAQPATTPSTTTAPGLPATMSVIDARKQAEARLRAARPQAAPAAASGGLTPGAGAGGASSSPSRPGRTPTWAEVVRRGALATRSTVTFSPTGGTLRPPLPLAVPVHDPDAVTLTPGRKLQEQAASDSEGHGGPKVLGTVICKLTGRK
jgi:hypothetical protein